MKPGNYDVMVLGVTFALMFIFCIINMFVLRWVLKVKKILKSLNETNEKLAENNELLRDLIDDVNTRREHRFEQQRRSF